jgi:hypothetical protein
MTENWHQLPDLRKIWLNSINEFTEDIAAEIDRERDAGRAPHGTDSRKLAALLLWATGQCLYISDLGIDRNLHSADGIGAELLRIWMSAIYGRPDP